MYNPEEILIIGKTGQLTQSLRELMPGAHSVGRPEFNVADASTHAHIPWSKYKIIINASAYTAVDAAETPDGRKEAWGVNAIGVRNLCAYALQYNAALIHVSTDYVFDGLTPNHSETEAVAPLNVYGHSKAAGELAVSLLPKHYIIRTQWLIGAGKNFVRTMYDLGKKGVSPSVVNDQFGRLTFTNSLADFVAYLLEHGHAYGTYHFSNTGAVASWADIAAEVFKIANFESHVIPVTTEEFKKDRSPFAERPSHCDFNLTKMMSTGFTTRDWQTKLKIYLDSLN